MTKKTLVQEIREKLHALNVHKDGCANISSIQNVAWVGYTQVCIHEHISGVLYKNKRFPLYSKGVTSEMLTEINKELSAKLQKESDTKEFVLELPNGDEVELQEKWEITDTDSYSIVEIIDCETNHTIGQFKGSIGDTEDEDFDLEGLVEKVTNAING